MSFAAFGQCAIVTTDEFWVVQVFNMEDCEHKFPRTQHTYHDRDSALLAYRLTRGRRKMFRVTVEDFGSRVDEPFIQQSIEVVPVAPKEIKYA